MYQPSSLSDFLQHPDLVRLLGIVESLAAAYVLAAVLAGCASPAATDPRASGSGTSAAEPSAAAGPRFAQGGRLRERDFEIKNLCELCVLCGESLFPDLVAAVPR